jgi:7,8-dihydropterin-6-yl-methyl-4-(beta-D-ribofuranosyl)aminobenzene 5'-phosphate synthase
LVDVGFGPQRPAFARNTARLGIEARSIDALAISHLHPDHMGGLKATRTRTVAVPASFQLRADAPCFTPAPCATANGKATEVAGPRLLSAGVASTGPLARMLCLTGLTEEQAFVAHVRGKGLVVITGCGHPTIELILATARRLSDAPLYAVIGGMHFPITDSRGAIAGIQLQQIIGTGKPWWSPLTDADLDGVIRALNAAAPPRLLLSAHDTCDHALERMGKEIAAEVEVLVAGQTYHLGASA